MKAPENTQLDLNKLFSLIESNQYLSAIKCITSSMNTFSDKHDLALLFLYRGFLNTKLKNHYTAADDFSMAILYEKDYIILNQRSKDIAYNARSHSRYKCNDFKGSIDDKFNARKLRSIENKKIKSSDKYFIDYKSIISRSLDHNEIETKYKLLIKVSTFVMSKYDLIDDFKSFISQQRKDEIISNLEHLCDQKFKIKDYRASIKAIRRAEKYY